MTCVRFFCNRPFPSYFEPTYESEAKCKVFVMKISFHSYANKTSRGVARGGGGGVPGVLEPPLSRVKEPPSPIFNSDFIPARV